MSTNVATPKSKPALLSPIAIIGMLFFIFGFITWLNGVLIPYLKTACQLNNFESYFVAFAFYIAYLVMAIPAAKVIKFLGLKWYGRWFADYGCRRATLYSGCIKP
jgi:FHS family L-fucose permease-like MFS transporter